MLFLRIHAQRIPVWGVYMHAVCCFPCAILSYKVLIRGLVRKIWRRVYWQGVISDRLLSRNKSEMCISLTLHSSYLLCIYHWCWIRHDGI